MTTTILGLDIGGANIKAATADGRAWHEPFALWKNPDGLAAVLREILARFPDAAHLAVTMTGELCDCYETKRKGVNRILDAVELVAGPRSVAVWGTDSQFHSASFGRENPLVVAAGNWHALATFTGRHVPMHGGLLLDIGSTTTDIIPLEHGLPASTGLTDFDRLNSHELVYTGVRRSPLCALSGERTAAEFFASSLDLYLVLGLIAEDESDTDTADGRGATVEYALARLARMLGGDCETIPEDAIITFAVRVYQRQLGMIVRAVRQVLDEIDEELVQIVVSGSGEFLARRAIKDALPDFPEERIRSLTSELGDRLSSCAPAYALAILRQERQS
ncbi:MAG: hydantoinase/oxoprolinase family protein [Gemmataceae bacterium]